jgi:hypothetical protein
MKNRISIGAGLYIPIAGRAHTLRLAAAPSLLRIQRVRGLAEELILQFQGVLIDFYRADDFGDLTKGGPGVELAEFGRRRTDRSAVLSPG